VIYDLMIHDLDLVLSLVRAPVQSIEAVGVAGLTPRIDIANARPRVMNGRIANLTAGRINPDRGGKVGVFSRGAHISIDLAAQAAQHWRLVKSAGDVAPTIQGQQLDIAAEEPLKRELIDFTSAVACGRAPLVTGEDGRRALELADQITARIAVEQRDLLVQPEEYSHQ